MENIAIAVFASAHHQQLRVVERRLSVLIRLVHLVQVNVLSFKNKRLTLVELIVTTFYDKIIFIFIFQSMYLQARPLAMDQR